MVHGVLGCATFTYCIYRGLRKYVHEGHGLKIGCGEKLRKGGGGGGGGQWFHVVSGSGSVKKSFQFSVFQTSHPTHNCQILS